MANVMSLKNLRNKVSRNGFDLSERNLYTAKVGELLPVMVKEVLPGDKFKINLNWFTRTQPVNTAAFTRIREYYDFYFVPIRLLWRFYDRFFTQVDINNFASSSTAGFPNKLTALPYFTTNEVGTYLQYMDPDVSSIVSSANKKNILGFNRSSLSKKLLQYLGYGDFDVKKIKDDNVLYSPINSVLNPLPLLAYQKIYQDFFRDTQWEKQDPSSYNLDYVMTSDYHLDITSAVFANRSSSFFDLHYCNWNKDYFMGLLPNAQYGSEAIASPLVGDQYMAFYNVSPNSGGMEKGFQSFVTGDAYHGDIGTGMGLPVIALRKAEFLQQWKEIAQFSRQDYRAQTQAHWNVDPGSSAAYMSTYLGGCFSNVDINEVVNSNLVGGSVADIAGKGVGGDHGTISFDAKEHGILMCIYHAVPLLDYSTGISKFCLKHDYTDFAIPEFDKIGMQSVFYQELCNYLPSSLNSDIIENPLGYAPRYVDYKTAYDHVLGEFRESLKDWVAPLSISYITSYFDDALAADFGALTYIFLKVNPSVLDSIFLVNADSNTSTDQLLCSASFDVKAVRNLDYNGLPY